MAKAKKTKVEEVSTSNAAVMESESVYNTVQNNKVTLKPIKKHGWLPEDHDGSIRYSRCFERLTVQSQRGTGILNTGLTEEDERRLENKMNMNSGTLSRYNTDYWNKFYIDVPSNGKELDTKNPKDELTYLVLKAHQRVANSELERFDSPFAEYIMTSVEQEAKVENKKSKLKRKAYKRFSNMSTTEMANVLKVMGKRAGADASVDFIEAQLDKIVTDNPRGFLETVDDPTFELRAFIDDCLKERVLVKNGTKYTLPGGDVVGFTLEQAIEYLQNPDNQEVYIDLKGKLSISK
tara:strand:+ start:10385 stop:11263 length:879 start_codon:yes stop_codon:yes gene_type:complete